MLRRRAGRMATLAAAATAALAAMAVIAVADGMGVDNDVVTPGNQNTVSLTAAPGAPVSTSGRVAIEWSGQRHVPPGTVVPFSADASQTNLPAGYSVASTSVSIPAQWSQSGDKATSPPASVQFTAPSAPGSYSYSVKWRPTGSGCWSSQPSCLTGGAALVVNLTVQAASSPPPPVNQAPTAPGTPVASATPNRGAFTLSWTAATDPDDDGLTYTLEHRDADDAAWSTVASPIAGTSHTFSSSSPASEGTRRYRVRASDEHGADGADSPASGDVVVDRGAPDAPTLTPPAPDYAGDGGWYLDSVSVAAADNGDPALPDGSAGSGVDPSSFASPIVRSASGSHDLSQTVRDLAGNESDAEELTVQVDADAPGVELDGCPSGPVPIESSASVDVAASDAESGLAVDPSGTHPLDTATIGSKTASFTAEDNVGHGTTESCNYTVVYAWAGFFRPVDPLPTLNAVRAGSAVPVKFSLDGTPVPGGDTSQGSAILVAGYPRSQAIPCSSTAPVDGVEETVNAGGSSLTYDAAADQYVYVWKTDKAWAGTCRQLVLKLADGSFQRANFRLQR